MSNENTLNLTPGKHDKLGVVHCGVTREGFIAVGGYPRNIDDGEEIVFDQLNIKASRQGSSYTFGKVA